MKIYLFFIAALLLNYVALAQSSVKTETKQPIMNQLNPTKYGFCGKLKAKSGQGDQLLSILLRAAEGLNTVQGCQLYVVCKDAQDPDTIWVMEAWDSKEEHDNSLKLDATKALIAEAMPIIDGKPEGTGMVIFGGKGIH